MKNFLLQRASYSKQQWLLLSLNQNEGNDSEYKPFTRYISWLRDKKGFSKNTVDQYAGHVARFLDFLYEASLVVNDKELSEIISLYETYLLFGRNSDDPNVVELAKRLRKKRNTSISSITQGIESSIKYFLKFILRDHECLTEFDIFSKYCLKKSTRKSSEIKAIRKNSAVAGSIKDSLNRAIPLDREVLFPRAMNRSSKSSSPIRCSTDKAFPLEKAVEYLRQESIKHKNTTFIRDMCIYSLLAASGVRTSECLQIQIHDIDTDKRDISIISPYSRHNYGLTEIEYNLLTWKGRQTELTFLIEPFATIFWDYLEIYINEHYKTFVKHDFIFQNKKGRPLFSSDRSNFIKRFKKYSGRIDAELTKYEPHSFRHMYGFYLLNYLPIDQGRKLGLPIEHVRILMGHQSVKSTEKYALHDTDLLKMYIDTANKFTKNNRISIFDLKEIYINNQIKKLESLRNNEYV